MLKSEEFYSSLQGTLEKKKKIDIMNIGVDRMEEKEKLRSPFGRVHRNDRGEKLTKICLENNCSQWQTSYSDKKVLHMDLTCR